MVAGLALATAIEQVVTNATPPKFEFDRVPMLIAMVVTLVPFYHGAMRHLEHHYVDNQGRYARKGALLADFLLLFIEACFFFVIAELISNAKAAAWAITALLAFDAIWGSLSWAVFFRRGNWKTELSWVFVNLVAVPVFVLVLLVDGGQLSTATTLVVMFLAIARTAVDYGTAWKFYFPSNAQPISSTPAELALD